MDSFKYFCIHSCGAVECGDDLDVLLSHCSEHGGSYRVYRDGFYFFDCIFGGDL